MGQIFCDYAVRIGKGKLGAGKRDAMLFPILPILLRIPLELGLWHLIKLARIGAKSHTLIWLYLP
jgi:hypothetical protein